jgi:hypothetical protein
VPALAAVGAPEDAIALPGSSQNLAGEGRPGESAATSRQIAGYLIQDLAEYLIEGRKLMRGLLWIRPFRSSFENIYGPPLPRVCAARSREPDDHGSLSRPSSLAEGPRERR